MDFSTLHTYASVAGVAVSVVPVPQNSEYSSGLAQLGDQTWHVRTARTTPTKPGAFVSFWCRTPQGATAPYDTEDADSGLMVFVEQGSHRGVFRFTRAQLDELGITAGLHPGKRGFRVYPPWCAELNRQAAASQRAQAPAFESF